jgi:acylphosphatase
VGQFKRAQIVVSGRVQGVAFRYYMQRWASTLNLTGWVRNRPDGKVEAVVEGKELDIQALIRRMKEGPPMAQIDGLDVEWQGYLGDFEGFRVVSYR